MRIDLTNIRFQGLERDDKTRKAGSKAASAPSVEDKASLSTDTLSVSALEAQAMNTASPSGRTKSKPCGSPSRTATTELKRTRLRTRFWSRTSARGFATIIIR